MRIAALVKQIPEFESMTLGADGRLQRSGLPLEMSAYCRRAVAEAVLLARETGGSATVVTLGPPSAEDVLREAIAFGADQGVHVTDPAFAGSDTLATARALAAALEVIGPFDLVLVGRNSVDADTGQVGPQLAELLGWPFATGVKRLTLAADRASVDVGLELDDAWMEATVELPAVLSTAERLIDPCKIKDPDVWATVDSSRIARLSADDLGPGPWGQAGSPTSVGQTRTEEVARDRVRLDGPAAEQVSALVRSLRDRGALAPGRFLDEGDRPQVPPAADPPVADRDVVVLVERGRERVGRELLSAAARLAAPVSGRVIAIVSPDEAEGLAALAAAGADEVVELRGSVVADDVAAAFVPWLEARRPWVVLAPSTAWGREVASRAAARLGAGLTGDAVGLAVEQERLVAWKPAFGGALVAAITASSDVQMATVRPGVLPTDSPRSARDVPCSTVDVPVRGRVRVHLHRREDDIDTLATAEVVIGVGKGVDPACYEELSRLRKLLDAELAATRKVTDNGWMPHARQVGITGHAIAPRLYFAIGTSGKYNHMVGVRSAGTVVAINPDPDAPVFDFADIGLVADWRDVVAELEQQLPAALR